MVLAGFAITTVRWLDTEVALDESDGLPRGCVLNLDTPELVPKVLLVEQIATLGVDRMHEVCRALAAATNC